MQVVWSAEKHVTRASGKRGNHANEVKRAKTSISWALKRKVVKRAGPSKNVWCSRLGLTSTLDLFPPLIVGLSEIKHENDGKRGKT